MEKIKSIILTVFLSIVWAAVNAHAATYTIDPVHSTIGFAVKHLVVGTTRGDFEDYAGTIGFDGKDLASFSADVVIQAKSINTKNGDRDKHLRSADFLDVENNPTITFKGKSLAAKGDGFEVTGDLMIHGVTKEVVIPAEISGPVKSPFGDQVIGLAGEITINRQDFGVSWNKTMDQGGLMVSDDVKIIVEIEAHQK